ncbi:hypothetical protein SAMN05519103_07405 [Rhizobiales bacterium GAS113]|jgi:hypothetical protein|nr:hypothetical protein SAMN05519103_07405 [Rhizobiales bacterium GAS113]SED36079.1 hypothetical protein SAMN05519104_3384 [Rhizobiales bacterium GAS188]
MKKLATITLVENSVGRNQAKTFIAQTVEIHHEADTIAQGADGRISTAHHPSKIFWFGGAAKDLANITTVKIVGNHGEVFVDGELNNTYGGPLDIAGGVAFSIHRT